MIDLTLLGSSGTIPTSERPLTSLYVSYDRYRFLVDCGEGTQCSIRTNKLGMINIDVVFLTHAHLDHVLGIAGLLGTMQNLGRVKPLMIVAPFSAKKMLEGYIRSMVITDFDTIVCGIKSHTESFDFGNLTVTAFAVKHAIPCYGYSFEVNRPGEYSKESVEAFGLDDTLATAIQRGYTIEKDGVVLTKESVFGRDRKGIKVVYATDTRPCQNLATFLEKADLAIVEGMYLDDPGSQDVTSRHSSCDESVRLASEARAKEVWLTHFSPRFWDMGAAEEHFKGSSIPVTMGYSGLTKTLKFTE